MEVVAHLPFPLLAHLRVVLAQHYSLTVLEDWSALEEALRRRTVDVIILDPIGSSTIGVPEIRRLRLDFPSIPVVVYTLLAPAAVRTVMELAVVGIQHVVLHRFDDEPRRFLALVESLQGYALGDLLLARISEPLAQLPEGIAQTIQRLFRAPDRFGSVADIAVDAGVNLRQLYRRVHRAGLASPRILLQSARLLRAFGYLQDPGAGVEDVAARLGYSELRVLTRQLHSATGMRGSALRHAMSMDEFLTLIAQRVRDSSDSMGTTDSLESTDFSEDD